MNRLTWFTVMTIVLLLVGCTAEKGTVIKGQITDAAGLQVFLDKSGVGSQASMVLQKADANASGSFSMDFPEGITPGIYRLRIGSQKVSLILDGKEKKVELTGSLQDMAQHQIKVAGSPATATYMTLMQGLISRKYNAEDIANFVDSTQNAYVAVLAAMNGVGSNGQFLDVHKAALTKAKTAYPDDELTINYGQFIDQMELAYAEQRAAQLIQEGQPAPDINLPSPDGKTYALSALKGKVVMLDFWASWCGPCRRANPDVVELYKKYKDQGFTIYSVSLDGPRQLEGLSDQQLRQQMDASKQKWVQAIATDKLEWPYHVSELKFWSSNVAKVYGVNSIPRTFLIDREGKIAKVGINPLQGGLDKEIEKLL
jgi:thiol-disulfide isomerase/thioredoxin